MNRLLIFVLFLLVSTGCSQADLKSKNEAIPLFGSMEAHQYDFNNGLRLIVVEDHSSPTFAYQTWFKVGSRNEEPGKTGLAHLFEHMLFKRTQSYGDGDFMKKLEAVGVEGLNAFTSQDYTAYIQKLPKKYLELIVKLESERMQNLIVDQKAFETELAVVKNERQMRSENSPDGRVYEALMTTAYDKHPYSWPIIGFEKDLASMKPEDAKEFYQKWYSPNQAVIIVVGDVNRRTVLKTVDQYYGKIKPSTIEPLQIPTEPPQKKIKTKKLKLNVAYEKLVLAFHVPSVNHPDAPVLEVIQAILSDGKNSRLTQRLVNTGIATSVSTGSFQTMDPSIFTFFIDLQKGRRASEAERIVLEEIEKLKKDLVSNSELKKAKNLVRFAFFTGVDSSYSIGRFIGSFEIRTGSFKNGVKLYQEAIPRVTAEDIKRVVKKYFNPSQRTAITGVPRS